MTHAELLRVLAYDPDTGLFQWRIGRGGKAHAGAAAGHLKRDGYVYIKLGRAQQMAHRVAWFYVHGEWPAQEVDHINRNRADNRLVNLREATDAQNMQNKQTYQNNTTGVTGVYRGRAGGWNAMISVDGRRRFLGEFKAFESAVVARKLAVAKLHPYRVVA